MSRLSRLKHPKRQGHWSIGAKPRKEITECQLSLELQSVRCRTSCQGRIDCLWCGGERETSSSVVAWMGGWCHDLPPLSHPKKVLTKNVLLDPVNSATPTASWNPLMSGSILERSDNQASSTQPGQILNHTKHI